MGASSFAYWVLLIIGEVASCGVHAVVATREGGGNRTGVGEAVVQGLWFAALCGLLSLPLVPLIPWYFRALGVQEGSPSFTCGIAYLHGLAYGVLPLTASGVLASAFQGVAELRPVLLVNVICVALNCVLDPWLMWGGFGMPAFGVAGAAMATNLCALVASVISFFLLRAQGVPLEPAMPHMATMALIARIGVPISVGSLLFTAIYIVLGRLLTGLGGANLAALGLGHRIESLAYTVCEGFSSAAATIVGQWLGAGRGEKARDAARYIAVTSAWVMLPLALISTLLATPIVSLITSDPATISAAVSYLRIVGVVFPCLSIEMVFDGALTGAGDTAPALLWGALLTLPRIPLAMWLGRRIGVEGVWAAIAVSTVFKAVAKWWAFKRSRLPLLTRGGAVA